MGESIKKINNGSASTVHYTNNLTAISKSMNEIHNVLDDISETSIDSNAGIDEINNAIIKLNEINNENLFMAKENEDLSKSIANDMGNITKDLEYFKFK